MIDPAWYWSTTARPTVAKPPWRGRGPIAVERLPGGCTLYRIADRGNAAAGGRATPATKELAPKRPAP